MLDYRLKLTRPDGRPSATLTATDPGIVAATIEGWLDKAPPEWFDEHGELTAEITHHGQPIDTAVLAEHITQFHDLTYDDAAIETARRDNPRRGGRDG